MLRKVNGVTYNPPSSVNNTTIISGSVSQSILNYVIVPANTFQQYDVVGIQTRVIKSGTTGILNTFIKIGPTLNISQTQVARYQSILTDTFAPLDRRISIQNLTSDTRVHPTSASTSSDISISSTTDMESLPIDWTVGNYIIVTGTKSSSSDSINCPYIILDLIQSTPL